MSPSPRPQTRYWPFKYGPPQQFLLGHWSHAPPSILSLGFPTLLFLLQVSLFPRHSWGLQAGWVPHWEPPRPPWLQSSLPCLLLVREGRPSFPLAFFLLLNLWQLWLLLSLLSHPLCFFHHCFFDSSACQCASTSPLASQHPPQPSCIFVRPGSLGNPNTTWVLCGCLWDQTKILI